jgi:uncharacterized protein YoxC
MSDAEKIQQLEREVARLSSAVMELSRSAATRRDSIQGAVDDLQNSVQLIFKHVHVPNITYNPGKRIVID